MNTRIKLNPKRVRLKSNPTTKWWQGDKKRWRNYKGDNTAHPEREFQQSKVYASERQIWRTGKFAERFNSIDEVQAFVDTVCKRAWFKRRFPRTLHVRVEKKCKGWAYGSWAHDRISIPVDSSLTHDKQWSFTKAIVLHELAHVVTPPESGGSHGRFFARAYLSLIRHVLGVEEYQQLRKAFKIGGVKYSPRMQLTDEERKRRSTSFIKRFDIKPAATPKLDHREADDSKLNSLKSMLKF